jgi:hypothetical protein
MNSILNSIIFYFVFGITLASYSCQSKWREGLTPSPPLSSYTCFINQDSEHSQVSNHIVSIRNKRINGAELESQYVVKTGNQNETEKNITDSIEYEIECPRCYNVMTLCSNFDTLFYSCEECDFSLYTFK